MNKSNQIRRLLLSLIPIQALAVGLPAINSLLNSFIIGRFLGSEALAAMGFIVPLDMAIVVINVILSNGAQVLSGKYLGKGDLKNLNRVFNTTSISAVVAGIVVTLFALLIPETLVTWLGARGEILPYSADYVRGIAPGCAFSILFACFLPFIQLERASKVCTASVVTMLIVNCGGNLLNALVFHGGTFGSGLATALANISAVLVCLFFFLFKSKLYKVSFKFFHYETLRSILIYGYPAGVPQVCNTIRTGILNNCLFAIGGTPALAALTVASNIDNSIGGTVSGGFVGGVNLISSILVGERDVDSLRALPKQGILSGYPIFIVAYALVFVLASPIAMLYGVEAENVALTIMIIRLLSLWYFTNPIKSMSMALYQAFNRHGFLTVFQILNCLIYPCIIIFCGSWLNSIPIVMLASVGAEIFSFGTFSVYHYIRRKKFPSSIFKLTDIPNTLSLPSTERFSKTLCEAKDISNASEGLIHFCEGKGLSSRESMLCGLCVEEIATVSLQNNLEKKKRKDFCIDLRVLHESEDITITLRDNGVHFDPQEWLNLNNNADPIRCIGIKYVIKQAQSVQYTSTLGLNVIVIKISTQSNK